MGMGKTLKEILKAQNMTIKELADKTGISVNTLYGITRRDSAAAHSHTLKKICDALEISPETLISLSEEKPLSIARYEWDSKIRKDVGEVVKMARLKAGLTQSDLARTLQTTQSTIARIENSTTEVSDEWIERISDALGIPFEDLVPEGHILEHLYDLHPLRLLDFLDAGLRSCGYSFSDSGSKEHPRLYSDNSDFMYEVSLADLQDLQHTSILYFRFLLSDVLTHAKKVKKEDLQEE